MSHFKSPICHFEAKLRNPLLITTKIFNYKSLDLFSANKGSLTNVRDDISSLKPEKIYDFFKQTLANFRFAIYLREKIRPVLKSNNR